MGLPETDLFHPRAGVAAGAAAAAGVGAFSTVTGLGLGGVGRSMASSSETVTNLCPLASNPSRVPGMASTVDLWMSWARMMDPLTVRLRISLSTWPALRTFQSSGSTSQRMVL